MSDHVDNREKLLKVAMDLFASRGFKGTSVRDIAQAMDMTVSNIYHYFGNKEGLLLAILENASRSIIARLRQVSELDMDPMDRFKLLLKTHIMLSAESISQNKIFLLDEENFSSNGKKTNRRIQREILSFYLKELETLKRSSYVDYRNAKVTAFNILGVVNWRIRWYRPHGPLGLEEVEEEIQHFILHGISSPRVIKEDHGTA
jgi:TetR/AcrR family transcriptional regulator, cholesterol catabolism regulator